MSRRCEAHLQFDFLLFIPQRSNQEPVFSVDTRDL